MKLANYIPAIVITMVVLVLPQRSSAAVVLDSSERRVFVTYNFNPIFGATSGGFDGVIPEAAGTTSFNNGSGQSYYSVATVSQHTNVSAAAETLSITGNGATFAHTELSNWPADYINRADSFLVYTFHLTEAATFTLQASFLQSQALSETWAFADLYGAAISDSIAAFGFNGSNSYGLTPSAPSGTVSGTLTTGDYGFAFLVRSDASVLQGTAVKEHNASATFSLTVQTVPEPSTTINFLCGAVFFFCRSSLRRHERSA